MKLEEIEEQWAIRNRWAEEKLSEPSITEHMALRYIPKLLAVAKAAQLSRAYPSGLGMIDADDCMIERRKRLDKALEDLERE